MASRREALAQHEASPRTATASLALSCVARHHPTFSRRQRSRVFRHQPEPVTAEKLDHTASEGVRTQVVASEMDKV